MGVVSGRLQDMYIGKVWMTNADALHDLGERRKRVWHPHPCRRQINNYKSERSIRRPQSHAPWNVDHGLKRMPTLFAPTALTTASVTSSMNRARFSTEPPYESVRWLVFVCKN